MSSYAQAIARACHKAFPPPAPLARLDGETLGRWDARLTEAEKVELRRWRDAHYWHPHQLRHTKATEIRREAGLDAARAVLGLRYLCAIKRLREILEQIPGFRELPGPGLRNRF